MKGTEFCQQIGPSFSKARQAAIVQAVADGLHLPLVWKPVVVRHADGRAFTLQAMNDALKIGEPDDFVRVNVSHLDAQHIADILDCRLPTERMVDLVYLQADMTIEPWTSSPDSQMASTARMQEHSRNVSKKIGEPEKLDPLVCSAGKDWVLTNRYPNTSKGANYGWHTKSKPSPAHPEWGPFPCKAGGYVFQPVGFCHDIYHTDYSQTLRLFSRFVGVEDPNTGTCSELELDTMLQDPDLAGLISYEGPLKWVRHPGIPLA